MRIMIKYVVAAALCIGTGGAYAQSDGAYAPSPEPRLAMMTPSAPSSPSSHVQKVGGCNGVSCEHGSNGGQTCPDDETCTCFCSQGYPVCGPCK